MRSLNVMTAAAALAALVLCPAVAFAGMNRTTDADLFRLELQLDPTRPVVGNNAAILTVIDARSGRIIEDAVIEIVPWMTIHGHGSPKKPSIQKTGHGRYVASDIVYTMEGDWDLLLTIRYNNVIDTAIFTITDVKKK